MSPAAYKSPKPSKVHRSRSGDLVSAIDVEDNIPRSLRAVVDVDDMRGDRDGSARKGIQLGKDAHMPADIDRDVVSDHENDGDGYGDINFNDNNYDNDYDQEDDYDHADVGDYSDTPYSDDGDGEDEFSYDDDDTDSTDTD